MDLRLVYFIGGLVVVLLLLLVSFVLNARRASRLENALDEIQEQLQLDNAIERGAAGSGSLDGSRINVVNAQGEEQPLDEVLSDLSEKIDAASAEQQKSYASIMADQQSLKHSISQLKTLISSLPTHAIAQAAASSAGTSGTGSAGAGRAAPDPRAATGSLSMSDNTVLSTGGRSRSGTALNIDPALQDEEILMPERGRNSGNRGPNLGSGMSASYARAQQMRQNRATMGAQGTNGIESIDDPDLQADLAFAAAGRNQSLGSGMYMPEGDNSGFVQTANNIAQMVKQTDFSQINPNNAPATIGEHLAQAQQAQAAQSAQAQAQYAASQGSYGYGQSSVMGEQILQGNGQLHFNGTEQASGSRHVLGGMGSRSSTVSGRDPRNPLGMGSYGVSSPKADGANAEVEKSVSAERSLEDNKAETAAPADEAAATPSSALEPQSEELRASSDGPLVSQEISAQTSNEQSSLNNSADSDAEASDDGVIEMEITPQSIPQHSLDKAQAFAQSRAKQQSQATESESNSLADTITSSDAEVTESSEQAESAESDDVSSASDTAESQDGSVSQADAAESSTEPLKSEDSLEVVGVSNAGGASFATVLAGSMPLMEQDISEDDEALEIEPVAKEAVPAKEEENRAEAAPAEDSESESVALSGDNLSVADDEERFDALQSLAANYKQLKQPLQKVEDDDDDALEIEPVAPSSDEASTSEADTADSADDDVAEESAGAGLTLDFASDDGSQFKVVVAKSESSSSSSEGKLPHNATDLEEEGLSFAIENASQSSSVSSADAVAAATAAQIAARPVAATVAQASGVGSSPVPVVDMIYDEDYVRKQQRDKPNGIDLNILDKANHFIDAGVSLMELSARTGLSEDELRLLYDVDENGKIKNASAIFEQMHGAGDDLALDEIEEERNEADFERERHEDAASAEDEEHEHEEQELAAALAAGERSKGRRKNKNKKRKRRSFADTNPAAALDQAEQQEIAAMMEHKEDPFAHSPRRVEEDSETEVSSSRSQDSDPELDPEFEFAPSRKSESSARDEELDRESTELDEDEHEAEHLAEVTAAERERQGHKAAVDKSSELERNLEAIDRLADSIIEKNRQKKHNKRKQQAQAKAQPQSSAIAQAEDGATVVDVTIVPPQHSFGPNSNVGVGAGAAVAATSESTSSEFVEAEPINRKEHGPRVRAGVQSYNQISNPVGLGSVDEEEVDSAPATATTYEHISTRTDAAQASSEIVKAMSDHLEINAPYVQQLRAGIADAIEQEDDNVTIAGIAATGGTVRSSYNSNNAQATMSAGAGSSAWRQQQMQQRRPASQAAVQAAMSTKGINAVGRINTREIGAISDDEDLVFSQAHANARANERELRAAAEAGDPHALMAGRKRQSTGNGLFSMLSTPLNAAQNLASQATSALRGGSKSKEVTSREGATQGTKSNGRNKSNADRVTLSSSAKAKMGRNYDQDSTTQSSAERKGSSSSSPVRYKRESGVIDVPVPLETMAEGKMTVDMALAQMDGAGAELAAADDVLRQAQGNLSAEASALGSANDILLGRSRNQGQMGQMGGMGQVGATMDAASFGAMREEQAYEDLMGSEDSESDAEMGVEEGNGELSPEQLETLKSLQTGAAAAMSTPMLSSNYQSLPPSPPRRRRDAGLDVLGTEPPRHFANLQARNAYGMRH